MLNEMVAEFVAPDPHDFTMHFFVLKSLVFHTHEKAVRLTNYNFVTDIEKVLMDYFATISLVIKERAAKISFSKGKNVRLYDGTKNILFIPLILHIFSIIYKS